MTEESNTSIDELFQGKDKMIRQPQPRNQEYVNSKKPPVEIERYFRKKRNEGRFDYSKEMVNHVWDKYYYCKNCKKKPCRIYKEIQDRRRKKAEEREKH